MMKRIIQVTVYRYEDDSIFERREFAHREELDKYLKSIVLENCYVWLCPIDFCQPKLSDEVS